MRTVPCWLFAAVIALAVAAAPSAAQLRADQRQVAADPTQALFDAIHLGDRDEVRAAIAAGANLGARNVLGLTPLDLALDLGQTEIAFFLMSLGRTPTRPATLQPDAQRPAAPAPPSGQRSQPRPVSLPPAPVTAAPTAPLWRGDGGSPVPEAGFLGFDAVRPAGARPLPSQQRRG